MKNSYLVRLLIILTLGFLGCQTEDLDRSEIDESSVTETIAVVDFTDKGYIEAAGLDEKLAYKEFHLSSLMEQVLEVNPDFEDLQEFKSSKEEDTSYYLETLLLNSLSQKNGSSVTSKDEVRSLSAFTDLDGETWYPILRRLKKRKGNGKKALYLINSYDEKTGKEFVKAYKLNKKGKLKLTKRQFTKEMFDNDSESGKASSSIYQLRLSSCPGGPQQKVARDCGGGGTGGGTSSYSTKIRSMTVKDKKESWIEKADVHFARISWGNLTSGVYYDNCPPVQYPFCDGKGKLIRKFSQKEVKKQYSKSVNYTINRSSNKHSVLQYSVFEYDSWPAGLRTYQKTVSNGATINLKYRSYQTPYDTRTVTYTGAYGLQNGRNFSVSNNAIKFNVN